MTVMHPSASLPSQGHSSSSSSSYQADFHLHLHSMDGATTAREMLSSWEDHFLFNDQRGYSHKPTDSYSSTQALTPKHPTSILSKSVNVRVTSTNSSSRASLGDAEKQEETQDPWEPGKPEWLIMLTMSFTSLIVALDATILVPVLPTIASDLHGTAQEAFWAGTSYLLSNAVFQPFIAAISDIFGRREVLLPSLLFFFTGSVICGSAHNFVALLAGRVIQGIGGAGIITLTQVIFADLVPLRQRPKYFSIALAAWGIGTVLGPLIGGVLVEKSTWRWCFWLNLPICSISTIMVYFFVRMNMPRSSLKDKFFRVDWIGAFLFISSLTSFLIAISWGGVQYSWSSWHTLVPLTVGALGLAAAIAWERFGASEPFLMKSLFQNPSATFSYLCAMLQGCTLLMALYYVPFYFTSVRHAGPLKSGIDLLPALVCLLPGSAVVSAFITRLGHYRIFIWSGWTIGTVGFGLLILYDQSTPTAVWATALCLAGSGMGMVLSSVNFSVQACVQPKDAGRAASMYAFMRSIGMSIGVAIGGSVFQNYMKHELRAQNLPESISLSAEGFVHQLWDRTVISEALFLRIQMSYVHGFKGVFEILTAICGTAMILSLFIKHFNMDKMLESKFSVNK